MAIARCMPDASSSGLLGSDKPKTKCRTRQHRSCSPRPHLPRHQVVTFAVGGVAGPSEQGARNGGSRLRAGPKERAHKVRHERPLKDPRGVWFQPGSNKGPQTGVFGKCPRWTLVLATCRANVEVSDEREESRCREATGFSKESA